MSLKIELKKRVDGRWDAIAAGTDFHCVGESERKALLGLAWNIFVSCDVVRYDDPKFPGKSWGWTDFNWKIFESLCKDEVSAEVTRFVVLPCVLQRKLFQSPPPLGLRGEAAPCT